MIDFERVLYDDFMSGAAIFCADADRTDEIAAWCKKIDNHLDYPLAYRKHRLIAGMLFVGNKNVYDGWHCENSTSDELANMIIIPWSVVHTTLNNLNNMHIEELIEEFVQRRAYININPAGRDICDINEVIEMMCSALYANFISSGDDDTDHRAYIAELMLDGFRNAFVDVGFDDSGSYVLNATCEAGICTQSETRPTIVYPVAYLAMKLLDEAQSSVYTDEDFSEIF